MTLFMDFNKSFEMISWVKLYVENSRLMGCMVDMLCWNLGQTKVRWLFSSFAGLQGSKFKMAVTFLF